MNFVIISARCLAIYCLLNILASCHQNGSHVTQKKIRTKEELELNLTLEASSSYLDSIDTNETEFLIVNSSLQLTESSLLTADSSTVFKTQLSESDSNKSIFKPNAASASMNYTLISPKFIYLSHYNDSTLPSLDLAPYLTTSISKTTKTYSTDISSNASTLNSPYFFNSSTYSFAFLGNKINNSLIMHDKHPNAFNGRKNNSKLALHFSGHFIENFTSLPILYISQGPEMSKSTTSLFPTLNKQLKDANSASDLSSIKLNTTEFIELRPTNLVYNKSTIPFSTKDFSTFTTLPELLPTPLPLSNDKAQFSYNQSTYIPQMSTTSSWQHKFSNHAQSQDAKTNLPYLKYKAPIRLMFRSFLYPYQGASSFHSYDTHSQPSSSFSMTSTPATLFDPASPKNLSAQMGSSVYIPCKIRNLGNKTVSWIRNRDSHILAVGRYIFIADARFDAWHEEDTGTWILLIKYVQERDKGSYECQVSTEPKMSHFVYFNVVSPLVTIPGGTDIHVKVGSTVSIKCFIENALQQPQYIFWYKGKERVVDERSDGPKIFLERITNDTSVGTLVIPHASPSDAGLYQCVPEKLKEANVTLHVINGEHPAAMQHCTSVMIGPGSPCLLILSLVLLTFVQIFAHDTLFST